MVKFDRMMKLPLRMQERNDPDDMETFGSIDLVDQDEMFISLICAESEEHRDQQNILDTRKDAVFILNAVNSFDEADAQELTSKELAEVAGILSEIAKIIK